MLVAVNVGMDFGDVKIGVLGALPPSMTSGGQTSLKAGDAVVK